MHSQKIISHSQISSTLSEMMNSVLGTSIDIQEGNCYAVAILGLLAMRGGDKGRTYFADFVRLLEELVVAQYKFQSRNREGVDLVGLIRKICKKEISFPVIDAFDPEHQILRDIPMICVYLYLFSHTDKIHELVKQVDETSPVLDQDFVKAREIVEKIMVSNDLINKLNDIFPKYQSIDGKSLRDDFKKIHEMMGLKEVVTGNDAASLLSVGIYSNDELKIYFQCIQDAVRQQKNNSHGPIQLLTFTPSHAISISYDAAEKKWYIVDTFELYADNIQHGINEHEVAKRVCKYHSNDKCAGFCAILYADKETHDHIKTFLAQDENWNRINNFNRSELLTISSEIHGNRNILEFAMDSRNADIVAQVVKGDNFDYFCDMNDISDCMVLLRFALENNNTEIVKTVKSLTNDSEIFNECLIEVIIERIEVGKLANLDSFKELVSPDLEAMNKAVSVKLLEAIRNEKKYGASDDVALNNKSEVNQCNQLSARALRDLSFLTNQSANQGEENCNKKKS